MDTNYFLYTPGIIIQKYGVTTAGVFGVVYYLSKRDDGYCWASQETIGKYVKLTDRSVRTHLRKLMEGGYIEKYSVEGQMNGYRPLHTWEARTTFEPTPEKTSDHQTGTPEKISGPAEREPRKKFPTKRSKENKYLTSDDVAPDPYPSRAWIAVLSEACGMDTSIPRIVQRIAKRGKELHQAGYVPDDVGDYFMPAWYEDDWRGQKGQLPSPENIVEKMGYYKNEFKSNKQREYENELKAKGYV